MNLSYHLPRELIAQAPVRNRDEAKLLVLSKVTGRIRHMIFKELVNLLDETHLLVLNNTKVFPARLLGCNESGKEVEVLLIKKIEPMVWEVLGSPSKRLTKGGVVNFDHGCFSASVLDIIPDNKHSVLQFNTSIPFTVLLDRYGKTPLPPYIKRPLDEKLDSERYQTVYAKIPGSCACPTAGIHFTDSLLEALRKKGVKIAEITLHIGPGTFRPINTEKLEDHRMEKESFFISEEAAQTINSCIKKGFNIVGVGTSTARALEQAGSSGKVIAGNGEAGIFIYPGYKFRILNSLITNFHQPDSTPLALVSAFAGKKFINHAYTEAIKENYRFFSYGDSMFIS